MIIEKQIYQKVEKLEPHLKREVLDFVEFVLLKQRETHSKTTKQTVSMNEVKGLWSDYDIDAKELRLKASGIDKRIQR
jgi:hypothetical protein